MSTVKKKKNMNDPPVHGSKGAYCGGKWLDLEECHQHFCAPARGNQAEQSKLACDSCPRSRTRHVASSSGVELKPYSAENKELEYDVVIIGAGCVGSSVARELSRTQARVLLLEAADDVTQGATKGNSGIVHAGYDDKVGSVKSKFCWKGNQMFAQLDKELHFGYQKSGSLVVAFNENQCAMLETLLERGKSNGVENLRIIDQKELRDKEPHIHQDAVAALYSPDAGTLTPYEFTIALAENAADNGVEVRIRRQVTGITKTKNGLFQVDVNHWEPSYYIESKSGVASQPLDVPVSAELEVPAAAATGTSHTQPTSLMGVSTVTSSMVRYTLPSLLVLSLAIFTASWKIPNLNMYSMPAGVGSALFLLATWYAWKGGQGWGKSASPVEIANENNQTVGRNEKYAKKENVSVADMIIGGSGSKDRNAGVIVAKEKIVAKYIVNAAGLGADKIAQMIGDDSFKILPRLGEYLLLDKKQGYLARHILFPVPDPHKGKGVLVQRTLWGNLILGPTSRDVHDPKTLQASKDEINRYILSHCRQLVPEIDATLVIHSFAGARAKSSRGDWIIEPSQVEDRFIHVAGIDSPGLAGSPAIALEVVRLLKKSGFHADEDPLFNPYRDPLIRPKNGWRGLKAGPVGKFTDPESSVICKCEKVTEAEVIECLRRSLPVDSTQAIRKRVRAGMGHCQADEGNYGCEQRVANVLARELKYKHVGSIARRNWPATSTLEQRWPTDEQKQDLAKLG